MSQLTINPYINFQGRARVAMEFYQAALGGTLDLLAFNDQGAPKPAGPSDNVMHARLETDGAVIMGTDGRPEYPPTVGDNFAISLSGSDRVRLQKIFSNLAAGGQIKQALSDESWGDTFGYFVDKFGINWMVNISKQNLAAQQEAEFRANESLTM
jgi:PhnB protein